MFDCNQAKFNTEVGSVFKGTSRYLLSLFSAALASTMAAACLVDDKTKETIQALITDGLKSPEGGLTVWNKVLEHLKALGLVREEQLDPILFLVHQANRGGFGLNSQKMTRVLECILSAGADLQQLGKSVAFELPFDEERLMAAIEFNRLQVKMGNGTIAALTGHERFATVSCSHTVAGFKALRLNCKTTGSPATAEQKVSSPFAVHTWVPITAQAPRPSTQGLPLSAKSSSTSPSQSLSTPSQASSAPG